MPEALPAISPSISNEQCYQQPFQTSFCIGVSEMLLTELPEYETAGRISSNSCKKVVHQLAISSTYDAHRLPQKSKVRALHGLHQQTGEDSFFIEVFDFQIREPLSALFVGENSMCFLNNRLVLFSSITQVNRSRSKTSQAKNRLEYSIVIFQMDLSTIRLRKRCIDQIIVVLSTLQKNTLYRAVIRLDGRSSHSWAQLSPYPRQILPLSSYQKTSFQVSP